MKTLLLSVGLLLMASVLPAGERVALIIGNNAYPEPARLGNCVNDATAVRDLLRDHLGFAESRIVFASDQNRAGIYGKLEAFKKLAAGAEIALIYYAGHGMESLDGRETFLIPTDADLAGAAESEALLRATGIKLSEVLEDVGKITSGAKVILLDCCRDRPKARTAKGEAVVGGGLATLPEDRLPADTFILLAAAPNRQASDGNDHGPFTQALLDVLPKGGQSMFDAFFAVSDRVQAVTRKQQIPWLKFDGSGALFRQNALVTGAAGPTAAMVVTPPAPVPVSAPVPVPTPPDDYSVFAGKTAGERKLVEVAPGVAVPFRWCPPGSFTMGSPQSEKDLLKAAGVEESVYADEVPHRITLTRGFWLAETEVTQGQWQAVMGTTVLQQAELALRDDTLYDLGGKKQTLRNFFVTNKDSDASMWIGPESEKVAMYWVSHGESEDWCGKASRHAGQRGWAVALPSEAQWEYACRAGSTGMTYAGDFQIKGQNNAPGLDGIAWYGGNSSQGYSSNKGWSTESWPEKQYPGGMAGPRRVGGKEPNAWGLLDMIGNVWEWTADYYGDYTTASVTDPPGASSGVFRVGRGGSGRDNAPDCRAANRGWIMPSFRIFNLSFRPALVPSH
ncbi:MAG: SUMF1/EgtB/PvdO family nonheme iron enzyme [Verrucomicrobiales bacterium]